MRINSIFRYAYRKMIGEFKYAKKHGLVAGSGCTCMGNVNFGSEPYLITLGNNVRISGDVRFVTHDGGTWAFRRELKDEVVVRYGRITVGDDTFIGLRSIIMPGVAIGKNCVIGAGSIVTHDVPDRTVVVGIPARKICTTDEYIERVREKMPENFDKERYLKDKKNYLQEIC